MDKKEKEGAIAAAKRRPVIFLLGGSLYSAAFLVLFSAVGLALQFTPQMIGQLAGVTIFVSFLPAGAAYVSFYEAHGYGIRWAVTKLFPGASLDSPQKRFVFLLVPLGGLLLLLSFPVLGDSASYYLNNVTSPLNSWRWKSGPDYYSVLLAWGGVLLMAVGLVISFAYDKTIGAVVRWIKGKDSE
jgi:hypothetical protein